MYPHRVITYNCVTSYPFVFRLIPDHGSMGRKTNTLAQLSLGESAIIESFTDEEMSLKLLEMGCTPGEKVVIHKIAPLGDPIAITVSGYMLSMRRAEASTVVVYSDSLNK